MKLLKGLKWKWFWNCNYKQRLPWLSVHLGVIILSFEHFLIRALLPQGLSYQLSCWTLMGPEYVRKKCFNSILFLHGQKKLLICASPHFVNVACKTRYFKRKRNNFLLNMKKIYGLDRIDSRSTHPSLESSYYLWTLCLIPGSIRRINK